MATIPTLALIPSGVKATKVYSVLPTDGTGDFNFTRSGSATRVNSQGLIELVDSNVPRLNYPLIDGVVQGCPSLLLEPQRSNIITYSESFDNAYWVVSPGTFVTANEIISPDGTLNADKVSETTFNGLHQIYSGVISTTISVSNTYSVFAKKAERNWIKIQNGIAAQANFNLENGTIGTVASGTTAEIEDYGNGWYRCKISFIAPNLSDRFYVRLMTSDNVTSYIGDGTSGVYLWGAMSEVGSYATSYIPNYGTALGVTRSAETCSKTGISSFINSSEGVLYAEISALANDAVEKRMGLQDAGTFDAVRITYTPTSNSITGVVFNNGASQCNLVHIVTDRTILTKIALKYKENDFSLWVNGIEVATDNSGTTFTNNALDELAFDVNGSANWHGNCKDLRVYTTALSDSELQALTQI